jgi:uncharacterized protein (TIGR02217 family)
MAAFHEVRFPVDISRGASGGPERRTDIVELKSGAEERNAVWKNSRRKYNAGIGLRNLDDVYAITAFFEARRGRLYGFRWKDWADYRDNAPNKISDVTINGAGGIITNGTQRLLPLNPAASLIGASQFQLRKVYSSGGFSYSRDIKKPVAGTVRIWKVDLVRKVYLEDSDFTVDYSTGIVSFSTAPITSQGTPLSILRAAFEFDVPVRFEQDNLSTNVELFNVGEINDIGILEIKV